MKNLLLFEWLPFQKKWSFYVLIIVFFAMGFMVATGAKFPFDNVYKNGSYINAFVISLFSLAGILSVTILAAQVLLKEQDANFQQVLYATPVTKNKLLLSRFIVIASISSLLFLLFIAGLGVGHIFLPADDRIGFNLSYYLQPFVIFGLPNILLCTAFTCMVGWLSKNKLMIYLSGLIIYILYIIVSIFSNSPLMASASPASDEAMSLAAKTDPFGIAALFEQTKYWSPAERNSRLLSSSGNLLLNRVVWLLVAALCLWFGIKGFQFRVGYKKTKLRESNTPLLQASAVYKRAQTFHGSTKHVLQTIISFIKIDFKSIVKGIPFSILCIAFIFLLGMEIFGTIEAGIRLPQRYVTTGLMVNTILKTIPFICLLAILFYSNELLWRSKNANIAQLENSTGMNSGMMLLSKIVSLSVIPFVLIVLSLATGITFQIVYQYPAIDIALYLSLFYTIGLPLFCCLVILLSIQSFFKNKYIGIAVAALFVLLTSSSIGGMLGLKNPLFKPGNSYSKLYSEMNGFDQYLQSFSWFILYVISLAVLVFMVAAYCWNNNGSFKYFFKSKVRAVGFILAAIIFIGSAFYIYFNNNVLNPALSKNQQIQWQANYENAYRKYEQMPQPVVTDVKISIDLFPESNSYNVTATYWLHNKTTRPIDSVLLYLNKDCEWKNISLNNASLIKNDKEFGHSFYKFNHPLAVGDSVKMDIAFSYHWSPFKGHQSFNAIVNNGSFLRISNYFPSLGYQPGNEIEEEAVRKTHGLNKPTGIATLEDSVDDNHFINLEMQVSTSFNQTAIAVGELVKEWKNEGRNYFQYKTMKAVPFRFAVSSAQYAVKKDSYNGKPIEVFYHPSHAENVDALISGAKRTLAYCEKNFGPYPFNSIRFAEISSFTKGFSATAYPATVFLTEDMVFHTNISKSKTVNVIGELTSHELAHQWWGGIPLHPANKEGRSVLTESLAMYTELMLNKEYGDSNAIIQLIKMYKGFYFSERGFEKETALYRAASGSTYLNYYKGVAVMYQLQLLLGEQKVNEVLKTLIAKHVYPLRAADTKDLLNELYAVSNTDQRLLIDELFKQIITHDIHINKAIAKSVSNNKYQLNFDVSINKYNELTGKKLNQPMKDTVDVAVYFDNNKRTILQFPIVNNKIYGKPLLTNKPVKIEVDPLIKLMDAFDEDNTKELK